MNLFANEGAFHERAFPSYHDEIFSNECSINKKEVDLK
jgi:hypothetical protein